MLPWSPRRPRHLPSFVADLLANALGVTQGELGAVLDRLFQTSTLGRDLADLDALDLETFGSELRGLCRRRSLWIRAKAEDSRFFAVTSSVADANQRSLLNAVRRKLVERTVVVLGREHATRHDRVQFEIDGDLLTCKRQNQRNRHQEQVVDVVKVESGIASLLELNWLPIESLRLGAESAPLTGGASASIKSRHGTPVHLDGVPPLDHPLAAARVLNQFELADRLGEVYSYSRVRQSDRLIEIKASATGVGGIDPPQARRVP